MGYIEDFTNGQFHLECSRVELVRRGAHPIAVAGPGDVTLDEQNALRFRAHVDGRAVAILEREISRPRQTGSLVADDELIQLTAEAYDGSVWTASIPGVGIRPGFNAGIAFGSVRELVRRISYSTALSHDFVRMLTRDPVQFPATAFTERQVSRHNETIERSNARDYAHFQVGNEKFWVIREATRTELHCKLEVGGPATFHHLRMHEAIQFALGQLFQICAFEMFADGSKKTVLVSTSSSDEGYALQKPPLKFKGRASSLEVYDIAAAYYGMALPETTEEWPRLFNLVYYILQASGAPLDLQALALGVAAEGIVATCFPDLAQVESSFISEVDAFRGHIEELGLSHELTNRLRGSLDPMIRPSNSARLRAFVRDNSLQMSVFQSWQRLRHSAAHASINSDFQTLLDDRDKVLYLCYAVILKRCHYAGLRSDYSDPEYPDVSG